MNVLQRIGRYLSGGAAPPAMTGTIRPSAAYMRGGRHMTFANWMPSLREERRDVQQAWDKAAARAVDVIHNSAWISGMVDQAVSNTVGSGLRLRALPDHEALGITAAEASALANVFERRFLTWANSPDECDVEGRRTFGQMQATGFRSWFPTGEIWAEYPYRNRPGREFGTKVRLVPATRIMRNTDQTKRLLMGVYMDADDRAVAYHTFREDQFGMRHEYAVPARTRRGRPRVTHVFDGGPGTVRGISPLVPALQVSRQFDQLADATITSWLIQSIFAASVTSDGLTEEAVSGLISPTEQAQLTSEGNSLFDIWASAQQGWYDGAPIDLGANGRIAHMFPGQGLEFHSPQNNAADYRELASMLLREIARCLGMTYESATGDYAGATYSSVRMATNEIFQITRYRRSNIVRPFCQPAYEAVIEEDVARGRISVPGGYDNFLARRTAFLRAEWRGTPQPQADDYKTAKKHETYWRMGVITDEMIAQDLGTDIETVYDGRAREQEMRASRGLPEAADAPAEPDIPEGDE